MKIKNIILKAVAVFFSLFGIVGLINFIESKETADIVLSIIGFALAYFIFKASRNKTKKVKNNKVKEDKPVTKKSTNLYPKLTFKVAGVSKINEKKQDIQKIIKNYVKEQLEFEDPYDGMKNKEMLEDLYEGDRIYEYEGYNSNRGIRLLEDPDNEYDPNAIKVYIDDIGHVGYIPKDFTQDIKNIMKKDTSKINWRIIGGKFKEVEDEEILIQDHYYGIEINVYE